jgi:hypothetical protein
VDIEEGIPWFRELYQSVLDFRRHDLYESVLLPWVEKAQIAVANLAQFKTATRFDPKNEKFWPLDWNLYALSRVSDFLLLPFQNDENGARSRSQLASYQYSTFFEAIGFRPFTSGDFSPFHHEIVKVHQSKDPAEPIGILATVWPGLMFGDMLFARSGVEVLGGSDHILKDVAENSTLYFAYQRLHRKTDDLSMGWGSNSQWRTSFRRDYEYDGKLLYNINGKNSLNELPTEEDRDKLTPLERLELCRNRCFIITSKQHSDLWPYDDRYEEESHVTTRSKLT